jgi:hypothetical protein
MIMTFQEVAAFLLSFSVFSLLTSVVLLLSHLFYFDSTKWLGKYIIRPAYILFFILAVFSSILGLSFNVYITVNGV